MHSQHKQLLNSVLKTPCCWLQYITALPDNTDNPTTQSQQPVDCTANPNDPSCPSTSSPQSLCPDGSTPAADGTCPLPPTSPEQSPTNTCPDGSTPAADGTCPSSPQQTTPPTSPYSWYGSRQQPCTSKICISTIQRTTVENRSGRFNLCFLFFTITLSNKCSLGRNYSKYRSLK